MSRQLQAAVGLGALGLGLTYIYYKKITSGSPGNILRDSVNDHTESDTQDKNQTARDSDSKDSVNDHTESDTQDKNQTAWDSDSKDIDIYLVYSSCDYNKVKEFQQNIKRHVKTQDVTVVLMDDIGHGMTVFQAFDKGFERSLFTFLFVTEAFNNDGLKKYLADSGLIKELRKSNTLWRLVPVWVDPGIEESEECPLEFSLLHGLPYDKFLEDETRIDCFKGIERLLKRKRGTEMMVDDYVDMK